MPQVARVGGKRQAAVRNFACSEAGRLTARKRGRLQGAVRLTARKRGRLWGVAWLRTGQEGGVLWWCWQGIDTRSGGRVAGGEGSWWQQL